MITPIKLLGAFALSVSVAGCAVIRPETPPRANTAKPVAACAKKEALIGNCKPTGKFTGNRQFGGIFRFKGNHI